MVGPVMTEATRGRYQESRHRGIAVVVDSQGHVIRSWGNVYEPVFGRSGLKLIQALPFLESGAADAFHLSLEEIALACASHHGEEQHIKALDKWLEKISKDERILDCGIHPPLYTKVSKKPPQFKGPPTAIHNACSGKHLALLTTILYRNEPIEGYVSREHPAQKRIEKTLSEMTDLDLSHAPCGTDGCNIPAFALPLYNIALAMACFADPSYLPYPRQKAIHRILSALKEHPDLMASSDGFDSRIIKATKGEVICKTGAGGIEMGIIPSLGVGVALKIEDGNAKAAEIAFLAILRSLGCLDDDLYEALKPSYPILSHKGKTIGFLQPTNFTVLPAETSGH